jgi:NADH-quinone oxidoreductase subunit E
MDFIASFKRIHMDEKLIDMVSESQIAEIISKNVGKPGSLLSTLEEIQEINKLNYLPKETVSLVAKNMEVPYSQLYSVITFYSFFNLKPQGKNCITVCRGTACHTKGSKALLDEVFDVIGVKTKPNGSEGAYTTDDGKFTVKTVACFGQCALSPVIAVNGTIHSNLNSQKIIKILKKFV